MYQIYKKTACAYFYMNLVGERKLMLFLQIINIGDSIFEKQKIKLIQSWT